MDTRNVQYNVHGTIDCEINHPVHGWIPFTASPDDVEPLGLEIYSRAVAGEYGPIAAYQAPVPTRNKSSLRRRRSVKRLSTQSL